jgi:hypothetical protein
MNNKSAIVIVIFFGMLLFTGLLMLQTCDGPPSSDLPGSFRLVLKASCPIAKDEQQFISDMNVLSTTFSAGNSPDKFFIPNVSLVRIDNLIPTSSDSASFDIPSSLMHYFKTSLVDGTQFREMRQDEEQIYFSNPNWDQNFADFRSRALRAHAEDGTLPVVNCADSNEFFMVDVLPENPPCPHKYWNDAAALKKHLEKQFGVKAPTQDVVIYYLCGAGQPSPSSSTTVNDTDGDSVEDSKDDCPTIAGKPVHNGCPDRDNDGVKDEWDRCPDVAGDAANSGCPKGVKKPVPPEPSSYNVNISAKNHSNSITFTKLPKDAKVFLSISGGLSVKEREISNSGVYILTDKTDKITGAIANKRHTITITAKDKDGNPLNLTNYKFPDWLPLCNQY